MKTIIRFMTFMMAIAIMISCVAVGGESKAADETTSQSSGKENKDKEKRTTSRTDALNALYKNTTLGTVELTFTDANWNKLLQNYNPSGSYVSLAKNRKLYSACDFVYTKDGKTYTMSNIGVKNRGNSSYRSGENATTHQTTNPEYQQAHFKLKFNKYEDDTAHHLERSAKAMNLKFMVSDASYVQEVYCYDLFRRFGVLTAPRCSYTKLYITVGSTPKAYFGVYKAVEAIDKQYLKERVAAGVFKGDDGNLWKCLWQNGPANLISTSSNLFGVDTETSAPAYSLKTNDDGATLQNAAIAQFKEFITNLNNKSGDAFKTWIASAFDVDGFLKALAVNVACGMWDDYWRNCNNYYIYFDTDGKAYFIPYDYDNTLGATNSGLMTSPAEKNPLEWGNANNNGAPLVTKILAIDEYMTQYKQYLADLASDSNDYLKLSASQSRINTWYSLIETYCTDYAASSDFSKDGESDWSLHKGHPNSTYNYLTNDNNYFTLRIAAINNAVGGSSGGNGGNNPTTAELIGYDVSGDNITFTFDPTMYGLTAGSITTDLYVCGSFTSWDINESYKMTKSNGIWSLTVNKPDNNSTYKYRTSSDSWYGANSRISGYAVPSGYFVSSSGDDNGNIIIK
ncbi:MAG: CotH kinase family protein [Spirochaetales bacterium]|nr:CotH kinase family protein [Spirochaetales bacterium]